ncbi:NUDIX hydrolase [Candidatus Woesearchaeota archaeon]|nr:NUDIX hydrolase [Candidatus Woesearchaeota archaeon]
MTQTTPETYQRPNYRNPFPTTDIIIEYSDGKKEGIVLITRKNPPHGLAIPGGFAEWGLSLEENARKEAREETGLEVILETPEQPLCVHSAPDRDPRAHIISIAYVAKGYGTLRAGDDAVAARLYTIPEVKELIRKRQLAFDHDRILLKYLQWRGLA